MWKDFLSVELTRKKEQVPTYDNIEDEGIEANTYSWDSRYGQKVVPVHYAGI